MVPLSGTPKIHACLEFLERLRVAGLLALPALRPSPPRRCAPPSAAVEPVAEPLVHCALSALAPVSLEVVRDAAVGRSGMRWWRAGTRWVSGAFGYRLRYFILAGDRRLGCVLLAGAARAVAVRDRWIGWTAQARRENVARVVNNSRFLIFPHVRVAHLANHVLGQLARRARARLARSLGLRALLLETFVDPRHYAGTCYRAAGWQLLGETSGRGLARPGQSYQSTPRQVWVKPLCADGRDRLCAVLGTPGHGPSPDTRHHPGAARKKKQQEKALNAKLRASGQVPHSPASLPNRCSTFATIAEEREAREDAVSKQMRLLRKELPTLLGQLEQIPDPRDPRKRRHKLTALLLYGLLMFVFQFSSRRETNREISRPQFMTTLQLLFPEIDTLPHADTLFRLLRDIDLEPLEQAHVDLVKRLIRGKSFRRYLINRCYPIAIDGSQKLAGDTLWAEELLQRTVGRRKPVTPSTSSSSRPVSPSTTVWSSRCSASSSNTRWAIAKRKSRMASCAALCA
ncbi:MAG: DUF4338 domain-containing protein [Candidatus Accumulibacter sp.]|uniref:DUF4338 domain-containing protein n=1 Tax=Candidatus Accumulibacter affinis TaxID=2954384 RepID=A0A935TJ35_9PROT|nr:DUF4338 domain-containing protein [Candidatus Accumulibacter affinis]